MAEAWTRLLSLDLPRRQSAFLWGARKAGKSTLLRTAFPQSLTYDFLKTDRALSFGARPALLREQLLALLRTLNHGLLPSHYLSSHPRRSVEAYVRDYLKEEVFDEGLTRNVPGAKASEALTGKVE
jgi:hypothetical protein